MTTVEKPRLKLRDTFTTTASAADGGAQEDGGSGSAATEFKEPIINERSQALREIIRHHEQGRICDAAHLIYCLFLCCNVLFLNNLTN